jgi:oligosaccharide repeat unit polymerase
MTFLIVALIIVLLWLSWKYILRLEPAGIFVAMWSILIIVILCCQEFIIVRFTGLLFILACVYSFTFGTIFCETCYRPRQDREKQLIFNSERATVLMAVLLVTAFVNPVYTIVLHGFSPMGIFDIGTLLKMNNTISVDRYSGSEYTNPLNQVFLVFSYTAPLFGGFCYRLSGRWGKALSLLSVIPCLFIAFTQAMKMGLITSVFLWTCGFLVCSYSYGLSLRVKPRNLLLISCGGLLFFAILFTSMVLRTGELSERIVEDITNKFYTYAFGYVPCFDIWFDASDVKEYSYGAKTFYGISNALGILERVSGIFQEWIPFGKNGFKGESNVYTVFRVLVEDFGPGPTCLVMMLTGGCSSVASQHVKARRNICLNQIILSALYAYVMWSFVTSFFAYTSYLVMFFITYFLLRFVQDIKPTETGSHD